MGAGFWGCHGPKGRSVLDESSLEGEACDAFVCAHTCDGLAAERIRIGDYEGAIDILAIGLEMHPEHPNLLLSRARLYQEIGYLRAAEGDLERALAADPDHGESWLTLGQVRLTLSLPRKALVALVRASALGLEHPELELYLARCHRALGHLETAAEHYARALQEAPGDSQLLVEAASLAVSRAEEVVDPSVYERALVQIDSAVEQDPDSSYAWFVRGLLLESTQAAEGPRSSYMRALERDPSFLEAWTNLALVCRENGEEEEVRLALEQAIALEADPQRRGALERLLRD